MIRGLYTSVSSMITLEQKQSVATNNIANINSYGYKSEKLLSKSFDEMLLQNNDNYKNGVPGKTELGGLSFGVSIDETVTDFSQGVLKETNKKADMGIQGSGFFSVRSPEGNISYTRDGSFRIDNQGNLTTNTGHYVLGSNLNTGNIEPINVGQGNMAVSPNNVISVDGVNKYSFNIVDFDDYSNLKKQGDNMYSGENGRPTDSALIKQGFIETSNIDITSEMANMMTFVREYEANQKVIQTIDSTLQKIANEIGAVR